MIREGKEREDVVTRNAESARVRCFVSAFTGGETNCLGEQREKEITFPDTRVR